LKFDRRRDDIGFLQLLEQVPRRNRHLGITGFECAGIGCGAGFDAQPRNFAKDLAIPLCELERRYVGRDLDCRIVGEDLLEEADLGLANASFAVW